MKYQLLNKKLCACEKLEKYEHQKCNFFLMFIFDISFNIGIYKIVPPAGCSATLYPESPLIVWLTLNRIFTHSSSTVENVAGVFFFHEFSTKNGFLIENNIN